MLSISTFDIFPYPNLSKKYVSHKKEDILRLEIRESSYGSIKIHFKLLLS